ncbi:hypothetical protein DICPUDRAFT_151994 [Dictyostelium purpureum]|uniref:DOCK family protein n=1 Tax=Dictyostelium purpureum TaxID=5786 RepID=F0ZK81_DICPU|nr:uncharacterized protein DICPUDRAFT_151994 [Dictyostelium purpureum]EGC35654.1 hypothetical protein DICPUDRAFT_151994 [Dictyostelium purpureum]|eukprot:XP_003287833.1 hypothetical protein DICPUDRAFT_151994 [Dictyostelium purpureum]
MEGKKISTFIKSRKSTSSSLSLTSSMQQSNTLNGASTTQANTSTSSLSSLTTNGNNGNSLTQSNSNHDLAQYTESYNKRNTRQIPSILLEDEIEKEEDYPFDFERYYYESKEINREISRELVTIPDDTVQNQIENLPKENRISSNPFDYKENKNQHIDDCIRFYSMNNWKSLKTFNYYKDETPGAVVTSLTEERVEFKTEPIVTINNLNSNISISISQSSQQLQSTLQQQQSTLQQQQQLQIQQNLKEITYLSQQHQFQIQNTLKTDRPDQLHLNYLERQFRKEKVSLNNNTPNEDGTPATDLSLYSYFTLYEPPVQYHEPTPYQKEKKRIIQVTVKDLSFKFWEKDDEPEPFFCSMYLYDIQKKTRLSESFYFDFVNDKSFKMLNNAFLGATVVDEVSQAKSTIFSVASRSSSDLENIYLILKVEKVLSGNLDDHSEPYIKMNLKEKEKEKFKESIKSHCQRLGQFRQAFCWGCIPLFEEGVAEDTPIRPLYRHRSEMTDSAMLDSTLSEGSKSASTKKLKIIPGQCIIDVKEIKPNDNDSPYNNKYILNSSLVKVNNINTNNNNNNNNNTTTNPILLPGKIPENTLIENVFKESQEFTSSSKVEINTEFVNNLYIYPEILNLSNRSGSFAARNLTCKIQLLETDENPLCPEGLKAIYGKSKNQAFVNKAYTQVTYHSKSPVFNDEVKIRLPLSPSPSLHILFTFYHIACQKSSDKSDLVDHPVAYGVLPIIQFGKLIGDEVFNIPLAYEFPSRYNRRDQEAHIKYIDNKKPIFQVRSKLVSSIHSTDDYLNNFFNNISQFSFINNCLNSSGGSVPTSPPISNSSLPTSPLSQSLSNPQTTATTTASTLQQQPSQANLTQSVSSNSSTPPAPTPSNNILEQLIKSIKLLPSSKMECIVQFFPIIMNQLFRLMTNQNHSSELSMVTFITIGEILSMVNDASSSIFERYVKYVFSNCENNDGSTLPVYEVLIKTWLELVRFQEQNSENILRFSRFFFSVIYKSMALSLIERGKREENKTRKGRFVGVRPQLAKLISILRWESSTRAKHTFKLAKELIRGLASFISQLLSIADRGYVFKIIDRAVVDFSNNSNGENEMELCELKFEFLRIICQNDYFVQLNIPLPFRIDTNLKLQQTLSTSKHFLSDLLLHNISSGIASKIALIRMDAANALRDTLTRLEMDTRWPETSNKQRIVGVFTPYLSIIVNHWDNIKDDSFIMKRNILISFIYLLKTIHPNLIKIWWREEPKAKHVTLFDILNQCSEIFEFVGKDILMDKVESSTSLRTSTAKSILEDFYSNSRNSPFGSKKLYNRSLREKRVDSRKSVLDSYSGGGLSSSMVGGSPVSDSRSSTLGSSNSPSSLVSSSSNTSISSSFSRGGLADSVSSTGSGSGISTTSGGGGSGYNSTLRNEKRMKGTIAAQNKINVSDYDDRLESHLALEVGSVILDIADEFMYEYERDLKTVHYFDVIEKIFTLLNSMLKKNQPVLLVPKLYATLRQFIYRFPKLLFESNNSFCLDLCNAVIRHCNSVNGVTREEASAFTYILFRKNFEQTRKNFVRTKTQVTIGLSTIVKSIKDDYFLKKSLDTINAYAAAQADKAGTKSFSKQIEDLTKRLHTFVIDNIKINNHRDDPEMVADLYHRIADNNKSNADTRICWLQGLADFHRTQENYVEAAQCYLHMSSLVAEYLSLIGKPIPTIQGSSNFMGINKNSLEESHTYIEREEDGADDNQSFTLDFFMKLIQEAILLLKQADYFEVANLVYKLLIPVHEHHLNYEELARSHGDLQDIFKKIVECTKTQSRMLGSYYRVGLYGKSFDEYSGKEFIYKEPKITRLVEIKDRLKSLYAKKLNVSEDSIVIIEGSQVDTNSILQQSNDNNKVYLQITSVLPYFTEEDLQTRRTPFDKTVNLNRFIFETPFTETGAGRANSVADQYKRKTILTVQNYFPYTKKRIQVTGKNEIIISPIENSIEAIETRTETLLNEVKSKNPNPKTLQQVLQGTLRLQVNSGPQEICRIFLQPVNSANDQPPPTTSSGSIYPQEQIKKLKKSLSVFLGSCAEALFINKSLVENQSSQEFQEEMEQGYIQLVELMETFGVNPPEGSYSPQTINSNSNSNSGTPTIQLTPLSQSINNSNGSPNTPSKSHSRNGSRNSTNGITLESTVLEEEANQQSQFSTSLSTSYTNRKSFTQRLSNSFKSDNN